MLNSKLTKFYLSTIFTTNTNIPTQRLTKTLSSTQFNSLINHTINNNEVLEYEIEDVSTFNFNTQKTDETFLFSYLTLKNLNIHTIPLRYEITITIK